MSLIGIDLVSMAALLMVTVMIHDTCCLVGWVKERMLKFTDTSRARLQHVGLHWYYC
jgi:hypothetical protein